MSSIEFSCDHENNMKYGLNISYGKKYPKTSYLNIDIFDISCKCLIVFVVLARPSAATQLTSMSRTETMHEGKFHHITSYRSHRNIKSMGSDGFKLMKSADIMWVLQLFDACCVPLYWYIRCMGAYHVNSRTKGFAMHELKLTQAYSSLLKLTQAYSSNHCIKMVCHLIVQPMAITTRCLEQASAASAAAPIAASASVVSQQLHFQQEQEHCVYVL